MKIKYILRGLSEQMPIKRFFRNFFITKNAWGMFSIYSHQNKNGTLKVPFSTKEKALKVAEKMGAKTGKNFSTYFCVFCGKYHIGKNN